MVAIFIANGNIVTGYHDNVDIAASCGLKYIVVDSIPIEFLNLKPNEILRYDAGNYIVEKISTESDRVDELEKSQADLMFLLIEKGVL